LNQKKSSKVEASTKNQKKSRKVEASKLKHKNTITKWRA